MNSLLRISTLALFVIAGMTSTSSNAATDVPFSANVTLSLAFPSATTFTLAGSGDKMEALHLGKISYSGAGTFTSATTDVLIETLTAANGDTLRIRCHQTYEVVGDGLLRGNDSATVIGGTGRFSTATGSLTGVTLIDLNSNVVVKSMQGRISY